MAQQAEGTFEVKVTPVEASPIGKQGDLGRMTLDKTFAGALTGASRGEMLTANTEESGAMAYVALERFTGTVDGRSGSFLLAHRASMLKRDPSSAVMEVRVVPASGTGELAGLEGVMLIRMDAGQHSYSFEYSLPHAS